MKRRLERGRPDEIPSFPYGGGVPQAVADLTVAVPFNDADALERRLVRLEQEGRKPACLIMEAAMMNLGVVLPEPGYLEAVREITRQHDVVLIFDEVKTGLAIAAGGATERFGVQPDMVTLAKTLGAGLPSGAIGATDEVMSIVESETVFQVGTFNGNPLTMAAARAGLLEVLTPEAYEHLDKINDRLVAGCQDVVDRYRLPAYTVGISSKGCVTFSDTKIVDYDDVHDEAERRGHRARLALQPEPRDLRDARPRGGVDAVGHAHRGGRGRLHRRLRRARAGSHRLGLASPSRRARRGPSSSGGTERAGRRASLRHRSAGVRTRRSSALLASVLDVPAGSIRVVGGQRGRAKVVEVDSLELGEVERRLERK